MKIKDEKGYTGIDIAISVVVLFIFVSVIAVLIYNFNSSSKEAELKSTYLAIDEIEKIKNQGFEKYDTLNIDSTQDEDGNPLTNQITTENGFYKDIVVKDYTDFDGNSNKIPNLVKQVTVKIRYMFNGEEQSVELSIVLAKE